MPDTDCDSATMDNPSPDDSPESLVIRGLLDRWAEAIARHDPKAVAEVFTPDALFQGFDPTPGYGQDYISAYYDKQPVGLSARYDLLSVRPLGRTAIIAYASVLFRRPDGPVPVYLTVAAVEDGDGAWALGHYHVSPHMGEHGEP